MKQVAVLGASSMLGQALCVQLAEQNISVIKIGRSLDSDIQFDLTANNIDFSGINLKANIFFHCAASFGGDNEAGIALNIQANSHSALTVARLATHLNCQRLVYAGSLASAPDFDTAGYSSYGFTKSLAEQQLMWLLERAGIEFCSLRFTHMYDTFGRCIQHQPWLGRAIAYAAKGAQLNLPEASAVRNFLHVADAAKMLQLAATKQLSGIFNALYPRSISLNELINTAYRIFDRGGQYQTNYEKTPFRKFHYPDGSDCWQSLGFKPTISLEQTFAQIKLQGLENQFGPLDVS